MLRVMLVDDEPMALEGMQLLIDWDKEGFEVAASCCSGVEALARLPDVRPDLVMTDLNMPEIDGLALIRAARDAGFAGRFIIVSGYEDFERARGALSLGVDGYILKPVDPDDAARAIDAARRELRARSLANERVAYQSQITAMMMDCAYDASALPRGGQWRLATWGGPMKIESMRRLRAIAAEAGVDMIPCIVNEREWLVLYAQGDPFAAVERLRGAAAVLGRTLHLSDAIADPAALSGARAEMDARLSRFDDRLAEEISALESCLAPGRGDELIARSEALQALCAARGRPAMKRALAMWRAACAHQFDGAPDKMAAFVHGVHDARDLPAISRLTARLLDASDTRVSDAVCAYARAHYAENLSLDGLAERFGYNPAYLGRVFRRETGTAFRAWLTDLRMHRAADMLRAGRTPVSEIARAVGIVKYQYFLDAFKAAFHTTPDAYRRVSHDEKE